MYTSHSYRRPSFSNFEEQKRRQEQWQHGQQEQEIRKKDSECSDCYDLLTNELNISNIPDKNPLKKNFLKLFLKSHPDKNSGDSEKFKKLKGCYDKFFKYTYKYENECIFTPSPSNLPVSNRKTERERERERETEEEELRRQQEERKRIEREELRRQQEERKRIEREEREKIVRDKRNLELELEAQEKLEKEENLEKRRNSVLNLGNILSRNLTRKSLKKIQGYRISPKEQEQEQKQKKISPTLEENRRRALRDILTRKSLQKLKKSSSSKRKKAGLTILKSLRKNTSRIRKLNIKPKERIKNFDEVVKEIPKAVKKRSRKQFIKQESENYRKREEQSNILKSIRNQNKESENIVIRLNPDHIVPRLKRKRSSERLNSDRLKRKRISERSNEILKKRSSSDHIVKSHKRKRSSSDSLISNMKRLKIKDEDEEDDKVNKPLKKRRRFRDGKF